MCLDAISKGSTSTLTALDLRHGFFQQSLDKCDRHITAFADTTGQIWQYQRVPKSLLNSRFFFHKMMSNILQDVLHDCVELYVDDLILFTDTDVKMFQVLAKVLTLYKQVNIKLNGEKCEFFKHGVDFLGYHITKHTIKISSKHLKAVQQFPTPTDVKSLRSFWGIVNYLSLFVDKHSQKLNPMFKLWKKDTKLLWTGI